MNEEDAPKEVKGLTPSEMKAKARPTFEANPDRFYPTEILKERGYSRAQCPKCAHYYWRRTEKRETCGDSACEGKYTFVGTPRGIVADRKTKYTYVEAFEGWKRAFSELVSIKSTVINRYPVVARWRKDVDYVAAGIYCFQPYCVSGELQPPANPLINGQFCLRFNDLDSVGISGRHYSGFVMLGLQVFNTEEKKVFFKEKTTEFNMVWLENVLGLDLDEITFIEDIWAGGGNLGPSLEYFLGGLELGNMVFMQYKTFPERQDDSWLEELAVKVIDVGVGLERVPWVLNGSVTSYTEVFPSVLTFLKERIGIDAVNLDENWKEFGPYSTLLNIDEVENIEQEWNQIAKNLNIDVSSLKASIQPIRDLFVIADHTRTVLVAIEDGSLPSNVGGASNLRNVLRRVFSILNKNKVGDNTWWELLANDEKGLTSMDGLIHIFELHKEEISSVVGKFQEHKSFRSIIEIEYRRFKTTDSEAKKKLDRLIASKAKPKSAKSAKRKKLVAEEEKEEEKGSETVENSGKKLTLEDWVLCVTSYGIDPDVIASVSGEPIPGNLFHAIAETAERLIRPPVINLYDVSEYPPTVDLAAVNPNVRSLNNSENVRILAVVPVAAASLSSPLKKPNALVVLNKTIVYPTGGGQDCDHGEIVVSTNSKSQSFNVINVFRSGSVILHEIDVSFETASSVLKSGAPVVVNIDYERRDQLMKHHTATHVVCAAARRVLGPHIWQNGAKKTVNYAHLDITHFQNISDAEELEIERTANEIVMQCKPVSRTIWCKEEAESKWGFSLYQGGIAPGNELSVVNIEDTDVEACCGTHLSNTGQIGLIRIFKSSRISDGIVRLEFVAGPRALDRLYEESRVLRDLSTAWAGVATEDILDTGLRFFEGYKKSKKLASSMIVMEIKSALHSPDKNVYVKTSATDASSYISNVPKHATHIKETEKNVVFVGPAFYYAFLGDPSAVKFDEFESFVKKSFPEDFRFKALTKNSISYKEKAKKGPAKKVVIDGIKETHAFGKHIPAVQALSKQLESLGFVLFE